MMQELTGKEVEVKTVETIYRGVLIEISETDVNLRSESGWMVIPLDRVVDIKEVI
jgi:hypothetical protein